MSQRDFSQFYRDHFLPEHQHAGNRWLHAVGVILSTALFPLAALFKQPWLLLAYPVLMPLPGLLGHRLFEPNAAVGHLRVTRSDAPKAWFWWANYVLTWDLLCGLFTRRKAI